MEKDKEKKHCGIGWDEYRCGVCGCFMGSIDTSTESGYDFELICNNPRCRSNRKVIADIEAAEAQRQMRKEREG